MQDNSKANFQETSGYATVRRCPFCGEFMAGDNRELLNRFDFGTMAFGCSKCIEKPIEQLQVPDGYADFHQNKRVAIVFDEYRKAIADAERRAGRL